MSREKMTDAEKVLAKAGVDTFAVRWLVDREHVATPDYKIEEDMRRRMVKWSADAIKSGTELDLDVVKDAVVQYALECHQRNFVEYCEVMGTRSAIAAKVGRGLKSSTDEA